MFVLFVLFCFGLFWSVLFVCLFVCLFGCLFWLVCFGLFVLVCLFVCLFWFGLILFGLFVCLFVWQSILGKLKPPTPSKVKMAPKKQGLYSFVMYITVYMYTCISIPNSCLL